MRTRLYVAGILGGLAVLVVMAVVVFAFGRNNPSPPSLQSNPNPAIPGELLFVDSDSCFVQAAASGESRIKRACTPEYFGTNALYWIDDNTAGVVRQDQRGAVLWSVNLTTGTQTDTGRILTSSEVTKLSPGIVGGGGLAPDGTAATTDEDGNLFLIQNGIRTRITSFDTPEYNQPQVVLWSPDSQWMVLQYYPRRADGPELWIVSRDGATHGTIAQEVAYAGVAWRISGVGTQPALP